MNEYTLDILGKLSNFYVLFYFVMGFLMTYSWICKELDYVTDYKKILDFFNPIAIITGIMNIIIFPLIILVLKIRISNFDNSTNWKSNILFYVVTIPTFLSTFVYMTMKTISSVESLNNNDYSLVSNIGEICFYFETIVLISFLTRGKLLVNNHQKLFVNFVILLTIFGMINSIFFYLTVQQIENFLNVSSNFSIYSSFYNDDFTKQRKPPNIFISNGIYLQPITLLFCCISVIYLTLVFSGNNFQFDNYRRIDELNLVIDHTQQNSNFVISSNNDLISQKSRSFKIPPFSIVVGILFITTSLIIIGIANSLMNSTMYFKGQLISAIYPIPIYIFSTVLLIIQINSMKQWQKLSNKNNNENLVDKMLLWVGATGQIIECVAQISMNFSQPNSELWISVIIEYSLCFIQIMFQTLMISLLLDRQWVLPNYETWQEYLCPPVGMLCCNLGFMIFSIFDIVNIKSLHISPVSTNHYLFMRIFTNGFQSIGVTLAILQRAHSSLIFGRILFSKYKENI